MGEDEDEQTNGQCPQIMHQGESAHEKQEKPKYKRHEFLKPKYGMVNMDVIDAVNARLAACDDQQGEENARDVEANFNLPYTILRPQPVEAAALVNKAVPYPADKTRSNKSITISLNKRKKLPTTSTEGAIADELSCQNQRTANTMPSRWQASFDVSCGEDGREHGGADAREPDCAQVNHRANLQPSARVETPPSNRQSQDVLSPANHYSPVPGRHVSRVEKQHPPMHRTHSCGTAQSSSIISHFKGLINTFNNLGCGSRLSRGVSVDETNRIAADQDRDSSYKMRSSASTGLRISPAVTTTKIAAHVNAPLDDNDDEKEQRRQRRLRRRSVECNVRLPLPPPEAQPPSSPVRRGIVQRSVVHAPAESVVKMRDNGEDEEFRIPLDDNNKPILFYKRKRYQFLNFPRASSKS